MDKGAIVVISGFSGVGKDTVVRELLKKDDTCVKSVSMTTRPKRHGETDNQSYYFVTREVFEKAIADGELVEYAEYQGNLYGTPKKGLSGQAKNGKNVILVIEVEGALNVKRIFPEALLIFIIPPSEAELERRLRLRGTDSEAVIKGRLSQAAQEARYLNEYEYIVVNHDVMSSANALREIIHCAKRSVKRNIQSINQLKQELQSLKF